MIHLYHAAQSRSFRILWLLEELGVPYRLTHMNFLDKSLRSPEFLALSPAGRVPALDLNGRVMFESGAIAERLVEVFADHGLGRDAQDPERMEWLEWLHFAETMGQHLAALTQQHIVLREDWMRSPVLMKLEAQRLQKVLGVVAAAVERRAWLLDSGFSAVDCLVGYGVVLAERFVARGVVPGADAYRDRIRARPAFQRAMARDGPVQIYRKAFYEVPDV